jgi:hypothetical protein
VASWALESLLELACIKHTSFSLLTFFFSPVPDLGGDILDEKGGLDSIEESLAS